LRFGFPSRAARRLQRFVSQHLTGLQPLLKRLLGLSRGSACQQIFCRDVFVEVWPMDADASPNDLPILPLSAGPMRKARVPLHRNRDSPTIDQFDEQFVSGDADLLYQGLPFS
jgi:hypothetical protein